jgi:hypothetical protein
MDLQEQNWKSLIDHTDQLLRLDPFEFRRPTISTPWGIFS